MNKSKKVSIERFLREQFGTAGKRISFRHEWNIGDPRRNVTIKQKDPSQFVATVKGGEELRV